MEQGTGERHWEWVPTHPKDQPDANWEKYLLDCEEKSNRAAQENVRLLAQLPREPRGAIAPLIGPPARSFTSLWSAWTFTWAGSPRGCGEGRCVSWAIPGGPPGALRWS